MDIPYSKFGIIYIFSFFYSLYILIYMCYILYSGIYVLISRLFAPYSSSLYCKRFAQPAGPILVLEQRRGIGWGCGHERRPCSDVRVARDGPCCSLAVSARGVAPGCGHQKSGTKGRLFATASPADPTMLLRSPNRPGGLREALTIKLIQKMSTH